MVQTDQSNRSGVSPMPIPKASQALARFTVLDLTRVRSGPTCVRQLADWGANVIKIEMPPDAEERRRAGRPARRLRLPEPAPQQAQHHSEPQGARKAARRSSRMVKKADVIVENFRPDVKRRLRVDYKRRQEGQPAHRLRQHLRLRPGRAVREPAGLRPDRPGHGRPDVDHRPAWAGAGARRHPGRRSHRRIVLRARHHGGAARAREIEKGPARRYFAAASADLHARLPGGALADRAARCPSRPATTIRRRSRPVCSKPPTATSTSPPPAARSGGGSARRSAPRHSCSGRNTRTPKSRSQNRKALNAEIDTYTQHKSSGEWIDIMNKAGVPCGPIYSIDQVFADPQVKHLGIARSVKKKDSSTLHVVGQPVGLSRTHEQDRRAAASARRAHQRGAEGVRLQRQGHRRAAQGRAV